MSTLSLLDQGHFSPYPVKLTIWRYSCFCRIELAASEIGGTMYAHRFIVHASEVISNISTVNYMVLYNQKWHSINGLPFK